MASSLHLESITLEPGDATRYDLDILRVTAVDLIVTLYKDRQRISGWTMKFSTSARCNYQPHSVAARMGCDIAQAGVVLAYLRTEYDLYISLDEGFNQDTGVWVGNTVH